VRPKMSKPVGAAVINFANPTLGSAEVTFDRA
jgi:hypothetical protein